MARYENVSDDHLVIELSPEEAADLIRRLSAHLAQSSSDGFSAIMVPFDVKAPQAKQKRLSMYAVKS